MIKKLVDISKNNIWVIIPGINEEKYIAAVLKKVLKQTENIIVVDDGSTDSMREIAKKYTEHVLSHSVNLGKGAALKTGCEYAFKKLGAEAVIFIDSDDQHDPEEIPLFVKTLETADAVFGVRSFNEKMPLFRIILNRLASLIILLMFGKYIPDIPCGYKAMSKSAYKKLAWNSADYAVEMEIAARTAKYKVNYLTIPIKTIYHNFDRGMTIIDTVRMITKVVGWRISL